MKWHFELVTAVSQEHHFTISDPAASILAIFKNKVQLVYFAFLSVCIMYAVQNVCVMRAFWCEQSSAILLPIHQTESNKLSLAIWHPGGLSITSPQDWVLRHRTSSPGCESSHLSPELLATFLAGCPNPGGLRMSFVVLPTNLQAQRVAYNQLAINYSQP